MRIYLMLSAVCVCFISYHPAYAVPFSTDNIQQLADKDSFFDKNKNSVIELGIRSTIQVSKKLIQQHWNFGYELTVGPVMVWHPWNGIGFQVGFLYSYNSFLTLNFSLDQKKIFDNDLLTFSRRVFNEIKTLSSGDKSSVIDAGLGHITFHAISIPLFLRLYPEKSRKFVVYSGPRFIWVLSSPYKRTYCPVHIDIVNVKKIFYDTLRKAQAIHNGGASGIDPIDIGSVVEQGVLDIYHSILNLSSNKQESQLFNKSQLFWDFLWDIGFEYRGKAGFVIGISGFGILLGYDCRSF